MAGFPPKIKQVNIKKRTRGLQSSHATYSAGNYGKRRTNNEQRE